MDEDNHPLATLQPAEIIEIRKLRSKGMRLRELSARFGIPEAAVAYLCNEKCWTHI